MTESHVLYRMFSHEGELLYVGLTIQPPQRFRAHRSTKEWWDAVANIKLETFDTHEALEKAERSAISAERPRYNVANTMQGRRKVTPPMVRLSAVRESAGFSLQDVCDWVKAHRGLRIGSEVLEAYKTGDCGLGDELVAAYMDALDIGSFTPTCDFIPCERRAS